MKLRVLGIVLAGGKGTRLYPLTKERAKPAVPFGGKYRIVDFVLSNFINSGIYSVYVLTQFKSQSLLQHLNAGWQHGNLLKTQFVVPVPAQMRSPNETWYQGTADAIYQNVNLIEQSHPDMVAIFGADHIYRMDIMDMLEFHAHKRADVSVAAIPVDKKYAREFGVIEVDQDGRILAFHEKKAGAPTIPGNPDQVYASMGNYVFSRDVLLDELRRDAEDQASTHDFGRDILPRVAGLSEVFAYNFQTNSIPGEPNMPYWRDVGTIDAYYEASMDLRAVSPALNLYNPEWPLLTASYPEPPAKFTFDERKRRGQAIDSIVSGGCILSGGTVRNSVLGRYVKIHAGALVEESIILDNCDIGRNAKIRRAILDKNVVLKEGTEIGYDLEQDKRRYHVTESGIVVVEGARTPVELSSVFIERDSG